MEGIMEQVRARLTVLADPGYAAFSAKLIPGCDKLLGVRLPQLRALAKELAKESGRKYIDRFAEPVWFEETMLLGMLTGAVKAEDEERLQMMRDFIPKIHNWSVCDSFCASLKAVGKHPEAYLPLVEELLDSEEEYRVRCGMVLVLDWYLDAAHIDWALEKLAAFRHPAYYAQMAAAWCGSVAYVRFPEKTYAFLARQTLDDWTHRMTIRKICESRRVTDEQRAKVRALKR